MEGQGTPTPAPGEKVQRRDFLKVGAAAAVLGAAAIAYKEGVSSRVFERLEMASAAGEETAPKTTCALCPSGCGLEVRLVDGKAVKIEGNPLHPLNQGVCCLRGQASLEVLYSPERLERPRIQLGQRGGGDWKEISWDEALGIVAQKLGELRDAGRAHEVALLHGDLQGQMRALLSRFFQAYGSPNVVERSSLAEQAARQAMFLTQGINGLPVYDLNNANYVMTFGGDLLESNRNVIGYLGSAAFMRRGRPQRGKLVSAHPRLSLTGIKADEWIPTRPGTYAALALGMANVIINSRLYDETFVRDYTFGFEDFEDADGQPHMGFKRMVLEMYPLEQASRMCGVASETIARLAGEFATNRPAVAVMPSEIGELNAGNSLYTAMAIHALNALVGSIDCPGGVLLQRFAPLADWPAYEAAAASQSSLSRMRIDRAGGAEFPLAISAYQNVAENILADRPYPLQALLLLDANPVFELPDGGRTVEALLKVPFVVSFASTLDESAAHSDLILPASTFLETWGDSHLEGTGYAGISLRRPVVETLYDTRNPGDVFLELATRLGGPLAAALPWTDYKSLLDYRLSGAPLDREKLAANGCWSEMVYFNAEPASPAWGEVLGRDRLNAPKDGRFDLFSRELFSLEQVRQAGDEACLPHFELPAPRESSTAKSLEFPYVLITQTPITQATAWQGIIPTLQECYGLQGNVRWSGWVEINPASAGALGLEDGDLVWVESEHGRVQAPVRLYPGIWPNAVFMPHGQGHLTWVRWGRNAPEKLEVGANSSQLVLSGSERLSGQAVTQPVAVRIYKVD